MVQRTIVAVVGFLLIFATARVAVQGQDVPYRVSDKELERLLGQMKKDTDRFRKSVDSAINKSHLRHEGRADAHCKRANGADSDPSPPGTPRPAHQPP